MGQLDNPPVEDGLPLMAEKLLEAGFSEDEVKTMAVDNTRRLAGARSDVARDRAHMRPTSCGAPAARSRWRPRRASRRA